MPNVDNTEMLVFRAVKGLEKNFGWQAVWAVNFRKEKEKENFRFGAIFWLADLANAARKSK